MATIPVLGGTIEARSWRATLSPTCQSVRPGPAWRSFPTRERHDRQTLRRQTVPADMERSSARALAPAGRRRLAWRRRARPDLSAASVAPSRIPRRGSGYALARRPKLPGHVTRPNPASTFGSNRFGGTAYGRAPPPGSIASNMAANSAASLCRPSLRPLGFSQTAHLTITAFMAGLMAIVWPELPSA